MSSILKVDTLQDTGANTILASDSSGNLTTHKLNYPAFRAYMSGDQSISSASATKIQFDTEDFDTNSMYDHSTNYRFTPTVAGKYFVFCTLRYKDIADGQQGIAYIYKNGSSITFSGNMSPGGVSDISVINSSIVNFNGSTDYVEIFTYHDSTGSKDVDSGTGQDGSWFAAYRIGD